MPYDVGDVAVLTWTSVDINGAPAPAGAISLTINLPDGTQASPTPTMGAPGVYTATYQTAQTGRHTYRWQATGTPGAGVGVGAYTDSIDVWPSLDNTILSLADVKEMLHIQPSTLTLDGRIRELNAAVTGLIERLTGGAIVVRQVKDRLLESGESEVLMLLHTPVYQPPGQQYPIISITPVMTYGLVYDLNLITVDTTTGLMRHTAGIPFWNGPYDVTYMAGRPIIQQNITEAAKIILRHLWSMERGGGGSGLSQSGDDTTMVYGFAIPNRALQLLEAPGTLDPGGMA